LFNEHVNLKMISHPSQKIVQSSGFSSRCVLCKWVLVGPSKLNCYTVSFYSHFSGVFDLCRIHDQ